MKKAVFFIWFLLLLFSFSSAHAGEFNYMEDGGQHAVHQFPEKLISTGTDQWSHYCYKYIDPKGKEIKAGCYAYRLVSLDLPGEGEAGKSKVSGSKPYSYYEPSNKAESETEEDKAGEEDNYQPISEKSQSLLWNFSTEYASREMQGNGESLTKKPLIASGLGLILFDPNDSHFSGEIKYSYGFGEIKKEKYQQLVYSLGYIFQSRDSAQVGFRVSYLDYTDLGKYARPKSDLVESNVEIAQKFFFGNQTLQPLIGYVYVLPVYNECCSHSRAEGGFRYTADLNEAIFSQDLKIVYADDTCSGLKYGFQGFSRVDFPLNGDIFLFFKSGYYVPLPFSSLNNYGEISGGGGLVFEF